ncbi:MAG: PilT/PilU family type 4a pilus ATPase [Deltaproteobacteria bacterium]|nr:PilT/PilU family type 4a pilus ATPase [Deltaproteobacteria bacterium]
MQQLPLEGDLLPRVVQAIGQSPLFGQLPPDVLAQVAGRAQLFTVDVGDVIMEKGEPSDSFYVVLAGEIGVNTRLESGDLIELARLNPPDSVGEMGLLTGAPRSATVVAAGRALLLKFEQQAFQVMYERIPGFGFGISRALAGRLATSSRQIPMPALDDESQLDPEVFSLLPIDFINRHRAVPIKQVGNSLILGFVDDASTKVLAMARELLPGMELRPQRITASLFETAMSGVAGVSGWTSDPLRDHTPGTSSHEGHGPPKTSPRLDALLRRLVAEGGSDLHISGGQKPRWRIDGEMMAIGDTNPLGPEEVYELLEPVMEDRSKKHFADDNDADFAYAIPGVARFRVNLFRDKGGASSVMRVIPAKVLTFEQLNLPPICQRLSELPKGLVLVTGPTGSGKSTTLAAMIDFINKSRSDHIITLEDPIEFVHQSLKCLINQREIGPHTKSFHRALKSALREDPDIVLVGEMRDLETVSLALETANTGHLVFGTLHTATAISTIDRIIDLFPSDQQNQVRSVLADTLKGVVAQTLCRKIGGGRCAALETLVVSFAVANLIREGKVHQIASAMTTGKALGNMMLNEALANLVIDGRVDYQEALSNAVDKVDLARRCNKPPPGEERPQRQQEGDMQQPQRGPRPEGQGADLPRRPTIATNRGG